MKLYNVKLPTIEPFDKVRSVVKKVDAFAVVSVDNNDAFSFSFQSKVAADEVARVFGGAIDVIEYDITKLLK